MFGKWMQKLKEKLKRMRDDDSGSAFAFVVIGVTALMIIGATVLSLATNYVVSVIVDQHTTDHFYETEGAVAEIRSGLEEICGKANEYAYMEMINNYNARPTSAPISDQSLSSTMNSMKEKYAVKYLTGIASILENPTIDKLDNSQNTVDKTSKWDGTDQDKSIWGSFNMDPVIKKMVTRPETVGSTYGGNALRYGFQVDAATKEMSLIISGLKVDYTDEAGYRTVVQTDIKIGVPDYGFEGNATFDELKKYIVICDDQLSVANTSLSPGTKGIDFTGNVYAGGEKDGDEYKTSIDIVSQAKNITFDSDTIITRGDLTVNDKAKVAINNTDGELWVRNILLPDSGAIPAATPGPLTSYSTELDLQTNAYVLDDLSIDNRNSYVNLGGKYYGYSYNVNNKDKSSSAVADVTSSKYSSAILINGVNTTLKSDHLTKLILSGRTFVSRFDNGTSGTTGVAEPDIMMGESLAVKSNQIAYLVPDQYIFSNGQGHNPLLRSEIDGDDYMGAVNRVALEQAMGDYLDPAKPVTANFNNTGGYVFLYLNFKNQQKANEYFSAFYSDKNNDEMLKDRAETYISTADNDGMKLGAQLYLIAGNIIHNYYAASGESAKQEANYFDGSGKPNAAMLQDGQIKMQNYLGKQLSLVNSGFRSDMARSPVTGEENDVLRYELLQDSDKSELVKDRIIDFAAVNADSSIMPIEKTCEGTDGKLYITPGDYNVDGTIDKGLIISGGNVSVSKSFEGLILAKGKVSVNGSSIDLKANLLMVGKILEMVRNDKDLSKYFIGLRTNENRSVDVADCISYKNWERDNETQLLSGTATP